MYSTYTVNVPIQAGGEGEAQQVAVQLMGR
jgi:hypothetical protein